MSRLDQPIGSASSQKVAPSVPAEAVVRQAARAGVRISAQAIAASLIGDGKVATGLFGGVGARLGGAGRKEARIGKGAKQDKDDVSDEPDEAEKRAHQDRRRVAAMRKAVEAMKERPVTTARAASASLP